MRFIKLTNTVFGARNEEINLSIDWIAAILTHEEKTKVHLKSGVVFEVKETPEDIINLIKKQNGLPIQFNN